MNAELLLTHFDRISAASDAIPRLRSFILDLAVRGKLVDQAANDEPASVQIARIRAKKLEFERALQLARQEISQQNDQLRRQWAQEQTEALEEARAQAEAKVEAAKKSIVDEVERAKSEMDMNVESLSTSIVESVAGRRAA